MIFGTIAHRDVDSADLTNGASITSYVHM